MATPQSSLIIKRYDGFGGNFIDSQYLGAAYETGKPYMFEGMVNRIFSSKSRFFKGKLLMGQIGNPSTAKEITSDVYRWRLQGAETRSLRVVENLESSNPAIGLNGTTFRVKFDLDYVAYPDVLFGEDNEFPFQVVEGPVPDGTGFVYTLKIQGDNPAVYAPASLFEVGKEFDKVWTSVPSEYNKWFGTQQYPNSFMLESQLGAFAQKYTVTDKAWREEGALGVEFSYTDRNGSSKVAKRFLPMAEAKMWDELYQGMEAQMVYGKKQTQPGKAGYWVKTGLFIMGHAA